MKRYVKWFAAQDFFAFRGTDGRERHYSEREALEAPMSEDTRVKMTRLLDAARAAPDQWIENPPYTGG